MQYQGVQMLHFSALADPGGRGALGTPHLTAADL